MNKMRTYTALLLFCLAGNAMAQPGKWDREKYPDLPDPNPTVNMKAAKKMIERMKKSIAAGNVRPDHRQPERPCSRRKDRRRCCMH